MKSSETLLHDTNSPCLTATSSQDPVRRRSITSVLQKDTSSRGSSNTEPRRNCPYFHPISIRYDNFLDTTYLADRKTRLRAFVERNEAVIMAADQCLPENLKVRYGG